MVSPGQSAPAPDDLRLTGDEATGANIVRVAQSAPLKQIAYIGGLESGVVAEGVQPSAFVRRTVGLRNWVVGVRFSARGIRYCGAVGRSVREGQSP